MAYIKPITMVYQEYATLTVPTQTAQLNACIIGPCYSVISYTDDKELAYAGDYSVSGVQDVAFPNLFPGAEIVKESVKILIEDATAVNATKYSIHTVIYNEFSVSGVLPTYLEVGDSVDVYDASNNKIASDLSILYINMDAYSVKLSKVLPPESSYVIFKKNVGSIELDYTSAEVDVDVDQEVFSITPLTYELEGGVLGIESGRIYVAYKALRKDISTINTIASMDELEGVLGKPSAENPLALAVAVALANTTTSVKCIGISSNDLEGYIDAKDKIELVDDVYAVVPLSQSPDVLAMFKSHAEQMSLPEKGKWRVAIGSTKLITEKKLASGTAVVKSDSYERLRVIYDDSANFMSNGVNSGDTIEITYTTYDSVSMTLTIDEVISEDMLTVTQDIIGSVAELDYVVLAKLDKTSQAKNVKEVSESFRSSRFIHVWPDVAEVDGEEVEGYYLAAAVAGMTAGLPSHQGFTNISVAGISAVKHSGDYFNETQLDIIADGGTFIFVQSNPSAAPYVRHQLTTDKSAIEFREFSFVKNYDYVSYICKDVLDNYLGNYNITPSTLKQLETAISGALESLKLASLPKIGSPVLWYEVVSVEQLETIRDRVEMYVNVMFPYVLNTIGLHLISN